MIVLPIDKNFQLFVECQHCKKVWDINVLDDNDYYIDITPIARNFNDSERVVSSVDHHASPELNFEIGLLLKRVLNDDYKEPNEGVTPCNF